MAGQISDNLDSFLTDIQSVAGDVLPVCAAVLLVIVGWTLACKLSKKS